MGEPETRIAGFPYIRPIWRLAIFLVVLADLVKIVFIQLAHETGKVAVLEVFGEDGLGEFLALDRRVSAVRGDWHARPREYYLEYDKAITIVTPADNRRVGGVLQHSASDQRGRKKGLRGGVAQGGSGRDRGSSGSTHLYSLRTWSSG